jgi:hypothetical protein
MPPLPPQAQVARPETLSTLTSAPESLVRTERHYSQIELFPVTRYAPDFTRTGGQIVQIELFPTVIHSSALSNLESRPPQPPPLSRYHTSHVLAEMHVPPEPEVASVCCSSHSCGEALLRCISRICCMALGVEI